MNNDNTMVKLEVFVSKYKWLKDMQWLTISFSDEQLERIWNSVNAEYQTIEQLENELEVNRDDSSIFLDVNLHSVIEYFIEFEADEIIKMLYSQYGLCIDIYYLNEHEIFVAKYEFR